jgi:hypothetical protein
MLFFFFFFDLLEPMHGYTTLEEQQIDLHIRDTKCKD